MSFTFFLCFFDFVRIHKIVLGCSKYLITDINIYFPFNFLAIAPLRQITSHVRALVLDQHPRKMETPHRIATTKAWTIRLVRCPINYKNIDFSFRLITLETLIQTPYLPKPLKTNWKRQNLKSTTEHRKHFLIFKKLCLNMYLTYMITNVLVLNMYE